MAIPNFTDIPRANLLLWLSVSIVILFFYSLIRGIYNLYFHPLSKYPGPKLVTVSNIWYAYNWEDTEPLAAGVRRLSNKLKAHGEMVVEDRRSVGTLWWGKQVHGDVVRIAPNELVFLTPQAGKDIHSTHAKNLEKSVRNGFEDLGEDGGISFKIDSVKHRDVAKKLSAAFSARNTKAKETVLHRYVDFFVDKMKAMGGEKGVELRPWADWLTIDASADMTHNCQMNQIKNGKSSLLLNAVIKVNLYWTTQAVSKKFPLPSPLMYLFIPPSVWLTVPRVLKISSQEVHSRVERKGKTEHLDYSEQLIPRDTPAPQDQKQINRLEQIAGQFLVAGWEPISNQFYLPIFFLLKLSSAYKSLVNEIPEQFQNSQ